MAYIKVMNQPKMYRSILEKASNCYNPCAFGALLPLLVYAEDFISLSSKINFASVFASFPNSFLGF